MNLEVKEVLYYSDLMYELKNLAGFEQQKDEEAEIRIMEREKDIIEEQESGPFSYLNVLSTFQQELFGIVIGISKKSGDSFESLSAISKYPDLVEEVLADLESKKNELSNAMSVEKNGIVLTKKMVSQKNTNKKQD